MKRVREDSVGQFGLEIPPETSPSHKLYVVAAEVATIPT